MKTNAIPVSGGRQLKSSEAASTPPAEAPTPTTGTSPPPSGSFRALEAGERKPARRAPGAFDGFFLRVTMPLLRVAGVSSRAKKHLRRRRTTRASFRLIQE
jgi:hypothetical protein